MSAFDYECTVNATITRTSLGIEEHGVMSFVLYLEWEGGAQALGGWALDGHDKEKENERVGWGFGITLIRKILETVGVTRWEDLKGSLVRARIGSIGTSVPPIIGHITKTKWLNIQESIDEHRKLNHANPIT